jgi:hypothetical protein
MIAKMAVPSVDETFETTFENVVREVFHGEPWERVEPDAARAFEVLSHDIDSANWRRVRDHLRDTWHH